VKTRETSASPVRKGSRCHLEAGEVVAGHVRQSPVIFLEQMLLVGAPSSRRRERKAEWQLEPDPSKPLILKRPAVRAPFATPRLLSSAPNSAIEAIARHGTVRSAPLHRLGRARRGRGVGLCSRRGRSGHHPRQQQSGRRARGRRRARARRPGQPAPDAGPQRHGPRRQPDERRRRQQHHGRWVHQLRRAARGQRPVRPARRVLLQLPPRRRGQPLHPRLLRHHAVPRLAIPFTEYCLPFFAVCLPFLIGYDNLLLFLSGSRIKLVHSTVLCCVILRRSI
jgi:hypothetical protein